MIEQGNPFPPDFDKHIKLRLVMGSTLLTGLVLSNAFKSKNVYKIVLSRYNISYRNVYELIEDNITVYSQIERFEYKWTYPYYCKQIGFDSQFVHISHTNLMICKDFKFYLYGYIETYAGSYIGAELKIFCVVNCTKHFYQSLLIRTLLVLKYFIKVLFTLNLFISKYDSEYLKN